MAVAIKTSNNSIRRVASSIVLYTNNDLVVSDRVGNRHIACSAAVLSTTATAASTTRATRRVPARQTTIL
jgi:hypothetical protein